MHRHHPTLVLATFPSAVSLSGMLPARAYLDGGIDVLDDLDMPASRSMASLADAILSTMREAADLAALDGHMRPDVGICRITHLPTAPFGRPAPVVCWRGSGSKLHVATPVPLPHLDTPEADWIGFDQIGRAVHLDGPGW